MPEVLKSALSVLFSTLGGFRYEIIESNSGCACGRCFKSALSVLFVTDSELMRACGGGVVSMRFG